MYSLLSKKWRNAETKMADLITQLAGSMFFVYLHALAFTLFFIFKPFDTVIFNIMLSLEAVFLATFIMVAQNRQAEIEEARFREEEEEEEEEREQIEEEFEDIQEDFDSLRGDLDEMRGLLERLESHLAQRGNVSLNLSNASKKKTLSARPEPEKEKVAV